MKLLTDRDYVIKQVNMSMRSRLKMGRSRLIFSPAFK